MNDLVTTQDAGLPDFYRPSALMDPVRFEHLAKVAKVMADSALMPATLRGASDAESYANAFMVVNIADRWGTDPFLTAQGMSVVYGRLMCEGKLVAAVLQKTLGITLDYDHVRDTKDVITGIIVSGPRRSDGKRVSIEGTIAAWATKEKGGNINKQWQLPAAATQLVYRGTREWVRVYEPGALMGIITDDEADPAYSARDITPRNDRAGQSVLDRIRSAKSEGATATNGFDTDRITETMKSSGSAADKEEQSVSSERSSAEGEQSTGSPSDIKSEAQSSSPAASGEGAATTSQAAPSTDQREPTEEEIAWRNNVTKMLWATAIPNAGNHGLSVLKTHRRAALEAYPMPDNIHPIMLKNLDRIRALCEEVITGAMPATGKQSAISFIANITGMKESEIGGAK